MGKSAWRGQYVRTVLVVEDRLSAHSGTSKMTLEIANGFKEAGYEVETHFFAIGADSRFLEEKSAERTAPRLWQQVTSAISQCCQIPLFATVWSGGFNRSDAVDFIGMVLDSRFYAKMRRADLTVFMNYWAAFPLLFANREGVGRTIVYFQEAPSFRELPWPLGPLVRFVVREILKRCDVVISPTSEIQAAAVRNMNVESSVLMYAFRSLPVTERKGNFVLLDTRWTEEREPEFALRIAEEMLDTRFVMAGYFPSRHKRADLIEAVRANGLEHRIRVQEALPEADLQSLYASATCYVRWSAIHGEAGCSYGLIESIGSLCPPIIDSRLGSASFLRELGLGELVVDRDPKSFARAIRRLFQDAEFYSAIVNRIDTVRNDYTWVKYCTELVKLVEGTK